MFILSAAKGDEGSQPTRLASQLSNVCHPPGAPWAAFARESWVSPLSANPANRRDLMPYSIRSAFIGAIPAARFAGITAATNEHAASALAATINASGSHHFTP